VSELEEKIFVYLWTKEFFPLDSDTRLLFLCCLSGDHNREDVLIDYGAGLTRRHFRDVRLWAYFGKTTSMTGKLFNEVIGGEIPYF
jgi:hypothetical protein